MIAVSVQDPSTRDINPPCFLKDYGIHLKEKYPLRSFLGKIKGQIMNLQTRIEIQKAKMEHLCTPGEDVSFIDKRLNAMKNEQTVLFKIFSTNRILIIEAIREHYDMLNTFAAYLHEIRETAVDITSWKSLTSIQRNIFKVMCAVKTILRLFGHDPESKVPSGQLSYHFYEYVNYLPNVCLQQSLEYVIVHDCEKATRYLELFYRNHNHFDKTVVP